MTYCDGYELIQRLEREARLEALHYKLHEAYEQGWRETAEWALEQIARLLR